MEHTGKSEEELQAALKDWYTIDESPATVEKMVEAQNWITTFFATTSYVTIQDKSIQPSMSHMIELAHLVLKLRPFARLARQVFWTRAALSRCHLNLSFCKQHERNMTATQIIHINTP